MAETKDAPATTVLISEAQHAQRELAKELAAMRAAGTQLDKTVPGGHYIGSDGRAHDAHGVALEDRSEVDGLTAEEAASELADLNGRRAALMSRLPAAQAEESAKADADAADRAAKAAEKAAKANPPKAKGK